MGGARGAGPAQVAYRAIAPVYGDLTPHHAEER